MNTCLDARESHRSVLVHVCDDTIRWIVPGEEIPTREERVAGLKCELRYQTANHRDDIHEDSRRTVQPANST